MAGGRELRAIQSQQPYILKEAILPALSKPEPLEGGRVPSRCARVTAAFSVGEHGAGLSRRWGQWEAKTGSPLPMERRSVLPVVKRKHYKVPVYVLK